MNGNTLKFLTFLSVTFGIAVTTRPSWHGSKRHRGMVRSNVTMGPNQQKTKSVISLDLLRREQGEAAVSKDVYELSVFSLVQATSSSRIPASGLEAITRLTVT